MRAARRVSCFLASLRPSPFAFLLLCVLALPAAEVARVGDQTITAERVRQTIARHGYNVFELDSAKRALEDVINTEVLAAAARQQGYDKDPEIAERIKQMLVEKFVQDKVDKPLQDVTPTEDKLKAYYESHPAEFSQPGMARAQLLTFMVREGKAAEALARANEALAGMKAGKTFEEIVAKNSDDPSERVSKGAATWFTEGHANRRYPEEVTTALFKLTKAGEMAGPIQTQRGVYLVRLAEKRAAIVRAFAESRPSVLRSVLHEKRQQAYAALCATLRQNFPVKINESQLTNAVAKTSPGAGPPRGPVSTP
jgi:peptidyl-prolyl cis-trans isomerase C